MAVRTPDLIMLTADYILQCICDTLDAEKAAGRLLCACPCRTCSIIGPPVADDCCEGQLHVWLDRLYYHKNFPQASTEAQICGSFLAGDFKIQYLTCAPIINDAGVPPSCIELANSASEIYKMLYLAVDALNCCLAIAGRMRKYVIRDARPISPDGGCVGWELTVTVELHDPLP